tara:strand:+ start:1286 stop:1453 length:168 start_codon:yes stop_codon:yes gene_type:complete
MNRIQIIGSAKKIEATLEDWLAEMDSFTEQDMWKIINQVKVHTNNIINNCKEEVK